MGSESSRGRLAARSGEVGVARGTEAAGAAKRRAARRKRDARREGVEGISQRVRRREEGRGRRGTGGGVERRGEGATRVAAWGGEGNRAAAQKRQSPCSARDSGERKRIRQCLDS
jgi:hypothetical protein